MKLKINVTQECIDAGVPTEPAHCPIAVAVENMGAYNIEIGSDWAIAEWNDRVINTELPLSAQEFIAAFDEDKPVEPFEFEIEIKDYQEWLNE